MLRRIAVRIWPVNGCVPLRTLQLAVPLALLLAGAAAGATATQDMNPAADPYSTVAPPATTAGNAVAGMAAADTAQTAPVAGNRHDLTLFFTIGIIANVLLVAGFLVWAVRQWRKSGPADRRRDHA